MSFTQDKWPPKFAGESDFRGIDWAKDLAPGVTITGFDFTVTDDSLTVVSKRQDPLLPITIIELSGGVAGSKVPVLCEITTSDDHVLQVREHLAII
jgi:hypothetical protein